MGHSITVTLPADLQQSVNNLSQQEGISPVEIVQRAVKQHVFLQQFRLLRERLSDQANRQGIVTDQDVFDRVS